MTVMGPSKGEWCFLPSELNSNLYLAKPPSMLPLPGRKSDLYGAEPPPSMSPPPLPADLYLTPPASMFSPPGRETEAPLRQGGGKTKRQDDGRNICQAVQQWKWHAPSGGTLDAVKSPHWKLRQEMSSPGR